MARISGVFAQQRWLGGLPGDSCSQPCGCALAASGVAPDVPAATVAQVTDSRVWVWNAFAAGIPCPLGPSALAQGWSRAVASDRSLLQVTEPTGSSASHSRLNSGSWPAATQPNRAREASSDKPWGLVWPPQSCLVAPLTHPRAGFGALCLHLAVRGPCGCRSRPTTTGNPSPPQTPQQPHAKDAPRTPGSGPGAISPQDSSALTDFAGLTLPFLL